MLELSCQVIVHHVRESTTVTCTSLPLAGALNRAEWLKFMGLFFNMDDSATMIFNAINSSYYNNSASYKAAARSVQTVAWLSRVDAASYGANAFAVSYAPYKLQYTQDAGGSVMSQAALGNMTHVLPAPKVQDTLWFTWNASAVGLTGEFATEAAAVTALHSFLGTVRKTCQLCLPFVMVLSCMPTAQVVYHSVFAIPLVCFCQKLSGICETRCCCHGQQQSEPALYIVQGAAACCSPSTSKQC